MKMMHGPYRNEGTGKLLVTCVLLSLIAGLAGAWIFNNFKYDNDNLIADYYETENAVIVSPHGLRKEIAKGSDNFLLVDLRSEEEYNREHIVGAVNVPAYKDKDTSDYEAVERIVNSFRALQESYPERDIVVYCYSRPCMTGRKVGKMLAEDGIYVKHLGIGWNEWKYDWTSWNHEHEWNITSVDDYLSQGSEPGIFSGVNRTASCPISGGFGC